MTGPQVRLLIVDDHEVLRLGLTTLFKAQRRFDVVGETGSASQAVAEARRCQPDVVIMDIRLPDGSGVEVCREIRSERPETAVLMLTSYADEDAVVASIMAGAAGYLLKQVPPSQLIQAVETIARGGSLLDPTVTRSVLGWMQRVGQSALDPLVQAGLSEQERKILPLIADGKTNREIAAELCLSERTVKSYVSNILQKLKLTRRTEAAAFAARRPQNRT